MNARRKSNPPENLPSSNMCITFVGQIGTQSRAWETILVELSEYIGKSHDTRCTILHFSRGCNDKLTKVINFRNFISSRIQLLCLVQAFDY